VNTPSIPNFGLEVITAAGYEHMKWTHWSDRLSNDHRWAVRVIDTTGRAVEQSAAEIRQWISDARSDLASGRLGPAGKWATRSATHE
jgi:hypothetical protein